MLMSFLMCLLLNFIKCKNIDEASTGSLNLAIFIFQSSN